MIAFVFWCLLGAVLGYFVWLFSYAKSETDKVLDDPELKKEAERRKAWREKFK
jgi:hypothetical protein